MTKVVIVRWAGPGSPSTKHHERHPTFPITLASLFGFFTLWQCASLWGGLDPRLLPGPLQVGAVFWQDWFAGNLPIHLYTSLKEFLWGFCFAALIGIPMGLWLGANRLWELGASPYLLAMYSTPSQAWQPLLIMWFGLGFHSQVLLIFLFAFFVIVLNVAAGVKSVDPILVRAAQSFQATRWETFTKVVVPATLPYIMTGLRLGVGRASIGVFLAEFFGASSGIGFYIVRAGTAYQIDRVFVGVMILVGFSFVLTEAIRLLETRMTPWKSEGR